MLIVVIFACRSVVCTDERYVVDMMQLFEIQ